MKILDSVIDFPNHSWGEDRFFVGVNRAGVIAGSSPISIVSLGEYHSQAEWLADNLSKRLIMGSNQHNLPNACKVITDDLKKNNQDALSQLTDAISPCAVFAGIEERDNSVYGYVLGDCTLVVESYDSEEIQVITDNRIRHFSNLTKEKKNKALAEGRDYKEAVREQMTKNRKVMNTKDGFWTIALRGEYQEEFLKCQYKKDSVKRCLLFSDGFERIFEHSLYSCRDILNQKVSLSAATKCLRDWENKASGLDVKKHDDVSAILVEF